MPLYWAKFQKHRESLFRLDTRIYLTDVTTCRPDDCLLGAVVGKNPGSAMPSENGCTARQPIDLAHDRFLPTVRSIALQAYRVGSNGPPLRGYIQVLNLFYLCDKAFGRALRKIERIAEAPFDKAETRKFPWIMYLWGRYDELSAPYIARFNDLDSKHHFYFDKNLGRIVQKVPDRGTFAKHTQGLTLAPVVAHVASLVEQRADVQ